MDAPFGSSSGGSKRLGEMELAQLEASGMKHCLQEFIDRSDSCVVDVCNRCKCITLLCACTDEQKSSCGTFECVVRSSAIKAMIGIRVCNGLNTEIVPEFH
jgi:DNA-directed RNA polymerase beta subunit